MSQNNSEYQQALEQIRAIELAVVAGDLVQASEQAQELMPMLKVDRYEDAMMLRVKVDALKASVRSVRKDLRTQIIGAQRKRRVSGTYQSMQHHLDD